MTHKELIELIYKYKEYLNEAFINNKLSSAPDELVEINLIIKVANKYKLNQMYQRFVYAILDRIDYSVVFQDYIKEHKELVRLINRFKLNKNEYYKDRILELCEDLYLKFFERDRQIRKKILDLYQEQTLEIELILNEANDILAQIGELIEANKNILKTFDELKKIDTAFRAKLVLLDEGFLEFVNNIHLFIKDLSKFINQTKIKRAQNKKFLKLSNDILNEKDIKLNDFLELNSEFLCFNIKYSKKNKIFYLMEPENKELKKLLKELKLQKAPKRIKKIKIKEIKKEKLDLIDLDKILSDLQKEGTNDLFLYLMDKVQKDINEVFKVFLQLLSYKNVEYKNEFNKFNIKVVKWIKDEFI